MRPKIRCDEYCANLFGNKTPPQLADWLPPLHIRRGVSVPATCLAATGFRFTAPVFSPTGDRKVGLGPPMADGGCMHS